MHGWPQLLTWLGVWIAVLAVGSYSSGWSDRVGWQLLEQLGASTSEAEMRRAPTLWWDAGQHYLPSLHCPMLADALLLLSVAFALVCVGWCALDVAVHNFTVALQTHSLIMALRCLTIFATVHVVSPVIVRRISAGESLEDIRGSIGWLANTNCWDMMFSGHTATSVVVGCFSLWSHAPLWLRLVSALLSFVQPVAIVLVGDHYLNDVVVGVYTAALCFALLKPSLL